MQNNDTRTVTRPVAEILKNRHLLFDAEIFLRHLERGDLYELESTEVMLLARTLAAQAQEKLLEVCGWLEQIQDEAERQEAAQ